MEQARTPPPATVTVTTATAISVDGRKSFVGAGLAAEDSSDQTRNTFYTHSAGTEDLKKHRLTSFGDRTKRRRTRNMDTTTSSSTINTDLPSGSRRACIEYLSRPEEKDCQKSVLAVDLWRYFEEKKRLYRSLALSTIAKMYSSTTSSSAHASDDDDAEPGRDPCLFLRSEIKQIVLERLWIEPKDQILSRRWNNSKDTMYFSLKIKSSTLLRFVRLDGTTTVIHGPVSGRMTVSLFLNLAKRIGRMEEVAVRVKETGLLINENSGDNNTSRTLEDVGITGDSTLELLQPLEIRIPTYLGEKGTVAVSSRWSLLTLGVRPTESVQTVKAMIEGETGIQMTSNSLVRYKKIQKASTIGTSTDSRSTLSDHLLGDTFAPESVKAHEAKAADRLADIFPELTSTRGSRCLFIVDMILTVRLLSREIHVFMTRYDTVLMLKLQTYNMTKIEVKQQILLCRGKELRDELTLAECELDSRSTVYCSTVVDMPGRLARSPSLQGSLSSRESETSKPELRCISLLELKRTALIIQQSCEKEGWTSADPASIGKLLKPEDVTLYDLVERYIKPVTAAQKCSYVDLLEPGDFQGKYWFVSHWWGMPVMDFVACLEQHAFDCGKEESSAYYWVCAHALNQHRIEEEVNSAESLTSSLFYKALNRAEGTVAVLDRKAVCYSRIWCSFEVYLSFLSSSYDAYALAKDGRSVGLRRRTIENRSYELTDEERNSERYQDRHRHPLFQMDHQKQFPIQPCLIALEAHLERSNATNDNDRCRILNFITGQQDQNAEPPEHHQRYRELNYLLRGQFAAYAYRAAVEADVGGPILQRFRRALSNSKLVKLHAEFHGCHKFRVEAAAFTMALPDTLTELTLDVSQVQFSNTREFAVGLGRLTSLKSLKLICQDNKTLCCCDDLWLELRELVLLEDLQLDFKLCPNIDCHGLQFALRGMHHLRMLSLHFNMWSIQKNGNDIVQGVRS